MVEVGQGIGQGNTLRITVFPAANGATTALNPNKTGAFHGAIPSTTPNASLNTIAYDSSCVTGMLPPIVSEINAAVSSNSATPNSTFARAQNAGACISACIVAQRSSLRSWKRRAASRRRARRVEGVVCDQVVKAEAEEAMASLM